ncbi:NACHT, LRR and PYD domains-containing protein 1 [Lamellibrachia satsuma]|nr:NACHT, LRR and PYD domains-containing protein 1 [Lamellibrachia satsuma]
MGRTCAKNGEDRLSKRAWKAEDGGRRRRGRPKLRWKDYVKRDLERAGEVGVLDERVANLEAAKGPTEKEIISAGDRLKEMLKEQYSDMVLDSEEPAPLDKVYVELRLQKSEPEKRPETLSERDVIAMERCMQESPVVKLPELFDKMTDKFAPKKVLIRGRAGVGKSTLVKHIVSQWAARRLWKDVFSHVFLITLREQPQDTKLTLRQMLFDRLPLLPVEKEAAFEEICRNPKRLLILGDGLDEIQYHHTSRCLASDRGAPTDLSLLLSSILGNTMLPGATVVVTSRSTHLLPLRAFDRTVELYGFPRDSIMKYVSMFSAEDEQLQQFIRKTFEENKNLLTYCYVPIQTKFVCETLKDVHEQGKKGKVPVIRTITQLYLQATINMARKMHPHLKFREVELGDVLEVITEPFRKYAELAKQCMMSTPLRIIFYQNNLEEVGLRVNSLEDMECGVMTRASKRDERVPTMTKPCWSFNHLTLQQYFSAIGLLQGSAEDRDKLLEDVFSVRQQEIVIKFMLGLVGDSHNAWFMKQLLSSEIPLDLKDFVKKLAYMLKDDPLKVLNILFEIQDPDLVDTVTSKIKCHRVLPAEMHALSWVLRQNKCPVTNLDLSGCRLDADTTKELSVGLAANMSIQSLE